LPISDLLLGKSLILKRSQYGAIAVSILYTGLREIANNFILKGRIGEEMNETFVTPFAAI
jgi:hypothetical protein